MLVYLDSSQLAELERLSRTDRKTFDGFFDAWRRIGAVLAFSLHHAQEIAQLADLGSIDKRMAVLKEFGNIQIALKGWDGVLDLEIQEQLLSLCRGTGPRYQDVRQRLFSPSTVDEIRNGVVEVRESFQQLREGLLLVAKAENLSKQAKAKADDVGLYDGLIAAHKDPDKPFPSDFDWDTWTRNMRQLARGGQAAGTPGAAMFQWLVDQLLATIRQEGSIRGGLQTLMGLKGLPVLTIAPIQDLAALQGYYAQAREIAPRIAQVLGVDSGEVLKRVSELRPYESPAFRLRAAYDRARKRAPKTSEASDQVDSDHLSYAPHVDWAFVDKRTWEYVQQEARKDSRLLPASAVSNIKKASSVLAVLEAIGEQNST